MLKYIVHNLTVSLLPIALVFKIYKSCSFVKIILMNKLSKTQDLLLVTELIFCNTPKANRKNLLAFAEGTRVMLSSGLAYKHTSSLLHSNDPVTQTNQCD